MRIYAIAFLVSLLLSGILIFLIVRFSKAFFLFPVLRARDIHTFPVSRLGGLALFSSFWIVFALHPSLTFTPPLWGIFISSTILFFFSLFDDLRERSWMFQLTGQILALAPLFFLGITITFVRNPFGGIIFFPLIPSLIFTAVWILLLLNALNWLDGLDGLSSGVGLIAVVTLFGLALNPSVNQPPVALMNAIMAGALVALFFFSFPPAKIFLGSAGVTFLGLFLATQSIFAGGKLTTTTLVLAPFLFDMLWVIGERLYHKQSPFLGDFRHLHFVLFKRGYSQQRILLFYLIASFLLGFFALYLDTLGKFILLLITFFAFGIFRFTTRSLVS